MAKTAQVAQVDFIQDCLREGQKRKAILAKFVKKWQDTSPRTFDRRLKQAEGQLHEEQRRVKAMAEHDVEIEAGELKSKIIDSLQRQHILSQIATGQIKIPNTKFFFDGKAGEVVSEEIEELPDHAARIKAIAELNKMDGSYAPAKQELDIKNSKISVKINK